MQNGTNFVYIGRVSGTAYEMGKAYGQLFAKEIQLQYDNYESMYADMAADQLDGLGVPQ